MSSNWRKIDDCWKQFALQDNFSLETKDTPYFHGVKTEYLVDINSQPKIRFQATIHKQNDGHNHYKTVVSAREVNLKKLSFADVSDRRFLWYIKRSYSDTARNELLELLRKHNANRFFLTTDSINIEYGFTFSQLDEFEDATKLMRHCLQNTSC